MSHLLLIFLAFFLSIRQEAELAISIRKFVYQKDMSEYCRRRVMPSVFLGRHVVQSHTEILHFSQLEVPYSCFISVRTESGSNIILVVQLSSDENMASACNNNANQVMVYEMGETFGGYWGPLPEAVFLENDSLPLPVKYYTQKTTSLSTTEMESPTEEESEEEEISDEEHTTKRPLLYKSDPDYIMVELPIVNVSGRIEMSDKHAKNAQTDEIFDLIYDVTPRPGQQYDTSVMPLAQFSISRQKGNGRSGGDDQPRFQIDYDFGEFTLDPRLSFWNFTAAMNRNKYRYDANRRLNFKKRKEQPIVAKGFPSYSKRKQFSHRSFDMFTKRFLGIERTSESWPNIEEFLDKYSNRSTQLHRAKESGIEYKNITSVLHEIANSKHNYSAYLTPNPFSVSKITKVNKGTRFDFGSYTRNTFLTATSTSKILYQTMKKTIEKSTNSNLLIPATQAIADDIIDKNIDEIIAQKWHDSTFGPIIMTPSKENEDALKDAESNWKAKNLTTKIITINNFKTSNNFPEKKIKATANPSSGPMVDHESWENVVQAAPVMAVLLNKSAATEPQEINMKIIKKERKKRFIQAIPIEIARPHSESTTQEIITTPESMFNFADMQDFAQLVELQDDEIHGRIALRYLRRYVGPTLFNICEKHDKPRHVFLFNSSRIVIALSNFTMKRMTVVATPARTLMSADARCPQTYLECQVSGARVCIDSMTACDGVPNCGAYDIYDEDRLMCGATKGLQDNVYLAAFTFLALLLTIFYTVHYWLKRCVPKVSDAFFIYTDGTENILYLDTIMRSPHDTDDTSKMVYRSSMYADDINSDLSHKGKGLFTKLKKFCGRCCRRNRSKGLDEDVSSNNIYSGMWEPKKMYSFTELEIQKMAGTSLDMVDTFCQTGESLEIDFYNEIKERMKDNAGQAEKQSKKVEHKYLKPQNVFPLEAMEERPRQMEEESELSMLRFFKEAKAEAKKQRPEDKVPHVDRHDVACGEETELHSHFYDGHSHSNDESATVAYDLNLERPGPSGYQRKRLRFDENLTTISSAEEADLAEFRHDRSAHSFSSGARRSIQDIDVEEQHSAGRDFMRFFGNKSKKEKPKKKTNTLKFV